MRYMCKLVVVVYHEVVVGILHSSLDLASSAACIFQRLFFLDIPPFTQTPF